MSATSLTPASQEALRVAGDLARSLNARLDIVHAVTLRDYPVDPDAADWDEQAQRTLAEQHEQVHAALDGCPQQWTYRVTRGDPVSLISSVAERDNALMIIVGTRGQGLGPAIERLVPRWLGVTRIDPPSGSARPGGPRATIDPLRRPKNGRERTTIMHRPRTHLHRAGGSTNRSGGHVGEAPNDVTAQVVAARLMCRECTLEVG